MIKNTINHISQLREIERISKMNEELKRRDSENKLNLAESPNNLNYIITKVISELGIPAHHLGFFYIRQGISLILSVKENYYQRMITTMLYPQIAQKYNTEPQRVGKAIRHSISHINTETDLYKELFSSTLGGRRFPTNSHFLAEIANYIKLNYVENK